MSRDKRQALTGALGAAARQYQRAVDAFDDAAGAYLGINRTDLRCLDVLLERGSATPGQLAAALGLTTGSVTTMLDRLETRGFMERVPDPADRRRCDVHATPKALRLLGRLWGPLVEEGARALAPYAPAELELMIDFLHRIRELQEAHTSRIRGLARRAEGKTTSGRGQGRGSATA